ncbi:MAG TPA: hypothetical protein V6D17_08675 [Candidatus Obscuribacterales bacterium]
MDGSETFNLQATLDAIGQALAAIICHVVFDAGIHGLVMASCVGLIGFVLHKRGVRYGKPLMNVFRRLSIFCGIIMIPGFAALVTTGKLPPVGVYNVNSAGFICFWSLICLHISAEEMNHFFFRNEEETIEEPASVEISETGAAKDEREVVKV